MLKNDKTKLKATVRKYLNTQFFSSVDEFSMCEDYLYIYTLLCKVFVVFYTVKIVYICVFITCSTFYCPCEKLMDAWNVRTYVSIPIPSCHMEYSLGKICQTPKEN